jgi:hypothetical protein
MLPADQSSSPASSSQLLAMGGCLPLRWLLLLLPLPAWLLCHSPCCTLPAAAAPACEACQLPLSLLLLLLLLLLLPGVAKSASSSSSCALLLLRLPPCWSLPMSTAARMPAGRASASLARPLRAQRTGLTCEQRDSQ